MVERESRDNNVTIRYGSSIARMAGYDDVHGLIDVNTLSSVSYCFETVALIERVAA